MGQPLCPRYCHYCAYHWVCLLHTSIDVCHLYKHLVCANKECWVDVLVQAAKLPALKPLVFVLKCMLKYLDLSEVYHGGVGGWTLVNMVIAHLQVGWQVRLAWVSDVTSAW